MGLGIDRIIDTQFLYKAKDSKQRPGLKTLAKEHLNVPSFQATQDHDALEDACVTRELLIVRCLDSPDDYGSYAECQDGRSGPDSGQDTWS